MTKTTYKTAIAKISYPNLFKPKLNTLSAKNQYSVDLLFSKNTNDIDVIKKAIETEIRESFPDAIKNPAKLKAIRNPIKDGDGTKEKTGEPYSSEYHGHWFITLKNERKPGVVDAKLQPIVNEEEIYGGCFGRASFTTYSYPKAGSKNQAIGRGVSLSLVNFQKVRDGEPLGGGGPLVAADADFDDGVVDSAESENPANYKSFL